MQLLGCGTILREVIAAADLLARGLGRRGRHLERAQLHRAAAATAIDVERWNLLHPTETPRQSYVETVPGRPASGPVVAATDYMRLFADQIRPCVPGRYRVLGHRRLRPLGLPQEAAPLLRGRPPLGDAWRRSRALAEEGTVPSPAVVAEAIAQVRHRPGQAQPGDGLSERCSATEETGQETTMTP